MAKLFIKNLKKTELKYFLKAVEAGSRAATADTAPEAVDLREHITYTNICTVVWSHARFGLTLYK
jgi:hypothetical protein